MTSHSLLHLAVLLILYGKNLHTRPYITLICHIYICMLLCAGYFYCHLLMLFRILLYNLFINLCCSNSLFASADTAYVLAYSIIMLTTDLHSSQVAVSIELHIIVTAHLIQPVACSIVGIAVIQPLV